MNRPNAKAKRRMFIANVNAAIMRKVLKSLKDLADRTDELLAYGIANCDRRAQEKRARYRERSAR